VRIAVIGVGHLGRHHARILAELPDVDLVGVVDVNRQRAEQVAAQYHTRAIGDWHDVASAVDAATIATPTDTHAVIATAMLEAGVHVLVEKPMTRTTAEADLLIAAAAKSGATLAVGHTERFNPAVAEARRHVREPKFIEVHRLGTFPDRSLDIDVVFDLMIHDLDLVLQFVGGDLTSLDAVGVPVLTPRIDIANVRLRFAGGCTANLTASRISRDRVRKIRFFQRDAYLSVDYSTQELEMWRLVPQDGVMPSIQGGKLEVPHEEPLKRELTDFVAAIRERRAPAVTGAEGRAALALAEQIVERMADGR
jgi:predicted dehydrogenase